ncbi:hypothetical protein MASR2M117_24520 [Paludibacter sp.]
MKFIKELNRFERLHNLILRGKTGTPKELADKLGISRALLFILIDKMKDLGLTPKYSKKLQSYYYEKEIKITLTFKNEEVSDEQVLRNIYGGSYNISHKSIFLDGSDLILSDLMFK